MNLCVVSSIQKPIFPTDCLAPCQRAAGGNARVCCWVPAGSLLGRCGLPLTHAATLPARPLWRCRVWNWGLSSSSFFPALLLPFVLPWVGFWVRLCGCSNGCQNRRHRSGLSDRPGDSLRFSWAFFDPFLSFVALSVQIVDPIQTWLASYLGGCAVTGIFFFLISNSSGLLLVSRKHWVFFYENHASFNLVLLICSRRQILSVICSSTHSFTHLLIHS